MTDGLKGWLQRGAAGLMVAVLACVLGGCSFGTPSLSEVEEETPEQVVDDALLVQPGTLTVALDTGDLPQVMIDEDGYYVLDEANAMTVEKNFIWKDEEGTIEGATIGKDALFEGLLTVTAKSTKDGESEVTYSIGDIDVADAAFVDAHDTDKGYSKTVSSLESLTNLVNDDKVGAVKLSLNVSKDGAVIIVVTDIAAK